MSEERLKSETTKDPLTLSELLSAISTEVAQLEQENSRPGWSSWALLGALATVFWLTLGEYSTQSNLRTVGIWFLFGLFASDVIISTATFLSGLNKPDPNHPRFHFSIDDPNSTPTSHVFFLFRMGVLLLTYLLIQPSLQVPTMVLYCAVWLVVGFIALPLRFTKILSTRKGLSQRATHLMTWALIIWSGYFSVQFFQRLPTWGGESQPSDLRIAFLLVGAMYLLQLLSSGGKDKPVIEKLKSIRRDLVFGRLELKEAAKLTDIALSGFTPTGVIEHKLRELLRCLKNLVSQYDKLRADCKAAAEKLESLESHEKSRDDTWRESARKVALLIDLCETQHRECGQVSSGVYSAAKEILRSVENLEAADPSPKPELAPQWDEVREQMNAMAKSSKAVEDSLEAVKARYLGLSVHQ